MPKSALAFERPTEEIFYPESDGEPMSETDDHRDELAELIFTLKRYFAPRGDVYVSGNLFLYYEEGDPTKRRAPDLFVVLGVPAKQRRTYKLWEEGEAPTMAIELTSKETKTVDQQKKPAIYAKMGIEYLFLYDVLGEYLNPSLQGKRLGEDGRYHPLVGGHKGPLPCPPLGLDLILDEEDRLQFVDRATGEIVVRERRALDQTLEALGESKLALEQAEERVLQEAEARRQAEKRVEQAEEEKKEMMAEIERLRSQLGG